MLDNFVRFINQIQMVAFAAFIGQIGWLIAITAFTGAGCTLMIWAMIHHSDMKDASIFLSYGFQVIVAVLSALGVKSGLNAMANHSQRTTAREYAPIAEAKARGKATGLSLVNVEQAKEVKAEAANGIDAH